MRHVVIDIRTDNVQPDVAYARIADFARYPELTETVLAVDVAPAQADGSVISNWLVRFRKGQLRWTERDVLDPAARRIEFAQLSGDFAALEGLWQVDPAPLGDGALIRFEARFDLGMPSLAEILDPVVESTLRSNVLLILTGLLGAVAEVELVTESEGGMAAPGKRGPERSGAGEFGDEPALETVRCLRLYRRLTAGVSIVSVAGPERPWGMTASTVTSVSLRPPLLLVCLKARSGTLAWIQQRRAFGVQMLRADQRSLARSFAGPDGPRFSGVGPCAVLGVPVLADCLAWSVCLLTDCRPYGDHNVVIGQVVATHVIGGRPLLWRNYGLVRHQAAAACDVHRIAQVAAASQRDRGPAGS